MVIKFPYNASRRAYSRRPRVSKNGTPEERAAKRAAESATSATVTELSRRAVLAGAAAMIPATAVALPAANEADPIFAAIARVREFGAKFDALGEEDETPEGLSDSYRQAKVALVRTVPQTRSRAFTTSRRGLSRS